MKVLFICKGNWFRSQMAAAVYNKITGTSDAESAGTYAGSPAEPEGRVLEDIFPLPDFFEFMEERGMPVRRNKTRKLTPEILAASDVVVSMAQEGYRPDFLLADKRVLWWDVSDPPIIDRQAVETAYAAMEPLVRRLVLDKSR